jgi:hypothetical protein
LLTALILGGVSAPAVSFDFDDLAELIRRENLHDLPAVLARLPSEYRENYTLVYDSHSLQQSNLANPRALLFGADATLVLTFNGDPSQRTFDELEAVQFRESPPRFEFHSIAFRGGKVDISPPNPPLCQRCHGADPHPIWGSYRYDTKNDNEHWPGVYGSKHDAPKLNAAEREAFNTFRARARTHDRYRHLRTEHPESAWFPYGEGAFQHRFRPNNRLGNLLARLNARRIADRVVRGEFFRARPATTLLWLIGCPQTDLPAMRETLRAMFATRFPESAYSVLHRELNAYAPRDRDLFMLEKLTTGLDVYTWNLSPAIERYETRFSTGITTMDRLVAARLLEAQYDSGSTFGHFFKPRSVDGLYDSFRAGYYLQNVAPGGIGEIYARLGGDYDEGFALQSCADLAARAAAEGVTTLASPSAE